MRSKADGGRQQLTGEQQAVKNFLVECGTWSSPAEDIARSGLSLEAADVAWCEVKHAADVRNRGRALQVRLERNAEGYELQVITEREAENRRVEEAAAEEERTRHNAEARANRERDLSELRETQPGWADLLDRESVRYWLKSNDREVLKWGGDRLLRVGVLDQKAAIEQAAAVGEAPMALVAWAAKAGVVLQQPMVEAAA